MRWRRPCPPGILTGSVHCSTPQQHTAHRPLELLATARKQARVHSPCSLTCSHQRHQKETEERPTPAFVPCMRSRFCGSTSQTKISTATKPASRTVSSKTRRVRASRCSSQTWPQLSKSANNELKDHASTVSCSQAVLVRQKEHHQRGRPLKQQGRQGGAPPSYCNRRSAAKKQYSEQQLRERGSLRPAQHTVSAPGEWL